jgi:hypothetical protein
VILGGCSYLFQLDRAKLVELLQLWMPLQGRAMVVPFRLVTPPSMGAKFVPHPPALDLVIDQVDAALDVGQDTGAIVLRVKAGVIRLAGHTPLVVTGGTLVIAIKFMRGTLLQVQKLSAAFRDLQAAGSGAIPNFLAVASVEADHLLDSERNTYADVLPDQDPSNPSPLKAMLLLGGDHRSVDPDTFCTLIGGPPGAMVGRLIEPGRSVVLAESAEVIKNNMIEPALRQQLLDPKDPNADLPPPWGTGTIPRDQDGAHVDITRLDFTFADGHLDIAGQFDAHDDCWWVSGGTFSQQMFLDFIRGTAVSGPTIASRMVPPTPNVDYDVHVKFLCRFIEIAGAAVSGLVGAFIYGIGFVVTVEVIKANANPSIPATDKSSMPLTAPIGATEWLSLRIIPEGAIVQGDITVYLPAPAAIAPRVTFTSTQSAEPTGASSGQVTVQAPTCEARTFDYTEVQQIDTHTLQAVPLLLIDPIDYTWRIDGTVLTQKKGVWTAIGTVVAALPPPVGTSIAGHAIELAYRIGPDFPATIMASDSLWLQARPADLNYNLYIEVEAVDAVGQRCANAASISIVGDMLQLGKDYDDYMSKCLQQVRDIVNRKGRQQVTPKPGDPQQRLPDVVEEIASHLRAGNPEAHALVAAAVQTYGATAVSSELARQLQPLSAT